MAILDGGGVLEAEREVGDREMMVWRPSRHCVRSGQGDLRLLQMELKSGGVPAVLSGVMVSMSRLLEKPGPKR